MSNPLKNIHNCQIGKGTVVSNFVNLYGCTIGDACKIGPFVEIQKNVIIGSKVKVGSHSFICEGVTIADHVFIGHHVVFINDKYPRSVNKSGDIKVEGEWKLQTIHVHKNAAIGSNATILGGIEIGENAIVGAGSVVTKSVPANVTVAGNPACVIGRITS